MTISKETLRDLSKRMRTKWQIKRRAIQLQLHLFSPINQERVTQVLLVPETQPMISLELEEAQLLPRVAHLPRELAICLVDLIYSKTLGLGRHKNLSNCLNLTVSLASAYNT